MLSAAALTSEKSFIIVSFVNFRAEFLHKSSLKEYLGQDDGFWEMTRVVYDSINKWKKTNLIFETENWAQLGQVEFVFHYITVQSLNFSRRLFISFGNLEVFWGRNLVEIR
jgi:hypothetical protein